MNKMSLHGESLVWGIVTHLGINRVWMASITSIRELQNERECRIICIYTHVTCQYLLKEIHEMKNYMISYWNNLSGISNK